MDTQTSASTPAASLFLPVPLYELENHHRRFDSLFSDPALGVEALESVLDDIYRHIAVEEYDLFPEVARSLSSQSVGSRT